MQGPLLGKVRAYGLTTATLLTGFLAGYDTGVAGGVLTFASFQHDFGFPDGSDRVQALTVSLLSLGCLVSCWIFFPLTERIGRRIPIMIASAVFLIGVIIQTINSGHLPVWYVGRVISGLGQGGLTLVTPTYVAEMAPKEIRGRLGSFYQWLFTWGVFTAYWIDYGVSNDLSVETKQWQIPVSLQLVSGSFLGISMLFLKESVRWLLKKGRNEEAWSSLVWIRGEASEVVATEFEHIKQGVHEEYEVTKNLTWRELTSKPNMRRYITATLLFLFQQTTGANALAYFAPQFFGDLVGQGSTDLLLTGLFGAIKVIFCTLFILFIADRFSRRSLMGFGALFQGMCMVVVAGLDAHWPAPTSAPKSVPSHGQAEVAMIFLAIAAYNWSWGPIPWVYAPEIFPNRIREFGMAVAVSFHWLFSFVFTFSVSYMLTSMGWGVFLFFGVFDFIAAIFVPWFFRETNQKSLETIDRIFEHRLPDNEASASPPGSEIAKEVHTAGAKE